MSSNNWKNWFCVYPTFLRKVIRLSTLSFDSSFRGGWCGPLTAGLREFTVECTCVCTCCVPLELWLHGYTCYTWSPASLKPFWLTKVTRCFCIQAWRNLHVGSFLFFALWLKTFFSVPGLGLSKQEALMTSKLFNYGLWCSLLPMQWCAGLPNPLMRMPHLFKTQYWIKQNFTPSGLLLGFYF